MNGESGATPGDALLAPPGFVLIVPWKCFGEPCTMPGIKPGLPQLSALSLWLLVSEV